MTGTDRKPEEEQIIRVEIHLLFSQRSEYYEYTRIKNN